MRPGYLKNVVTHKPRSAGFGMAPARMGPYIPGPPILSPFMNPHPSLGMRRSRARRCSSCR